MTLISRYLEGRGNKIPGDLLLILNHQQPEVAAHSDAVAVVQTLVVVKLLRAVNLSCDDIIVESITTKHVYRNF